LRRRRIWVCAKGSEGAAFAARAGILSLFGFSWLTGLSIGFGVLPAAILLTASATLTPRPQPPHPPKRLLVTPLGFAPLRDFAPQLPARLVFAWGVAWGALAGRDAAPRARLRSGFGHWGVGVLPRREALGPGRYGSRAVRLARPPAASHRKAHCGRAGTSSPRTPERRILSQPESGGGDVQEAAANSPDQAVLQKEEVAR